MAGVRNVQSGHSKFPQRLTVIAALIVITWAVFGQTVGFQFVNYDDPIYVLENPHVRAGLSSHNLVWAFTHIHSQNWHPLTTLSHMLDCQLVGLNPWWPHFFNVLLHSAAAVLLFLALGQMTRAAGRIDNFWASAFVAAMFAVHPLRAESVAWISERKDVLSGVFFMLTLIAYTSYVRRPSVIWYVTTSILFVCGLISKPMLVTTPIVLLLLDYWPLGRLQDFKRFLVLVREKIPLFLLSLGSSLATIWAQNLALGSPGHLPLSWRLTNALIAYVDYIRQLFWPVDLVPFYVHAENRLPVSHLLIAIVILVFISVIAVARRRKNPYLIVGWLWYLIMLLPVIGLIQVGLQGHADRYTYLPEIGLTIAMAWLICDLVKGWRHHVFGMSAAAAVIVITLSILSWKQTGHWRDTEALWKYTLSVTPNNDVAHAGLAGILFVRGQTDAAIEHYERALSLRDGNVAAHFGLAMALMQARKFDTAIQHLQKTLEIQPDNIQASNYLGTLLANKGELRDAAVTWRQTLSFDPENVSAANNLAWVLATASDPELRNGKEALDLAERAIRFGGETPQSLRTLAAALAEDNRFTEATEIAERAEHMAEANGDTAMAETLRRCAESFRRGEPLRF